MLVPSEGLCRIRVGWPARFHISRPGRPAAQLLFRASPPGAAGRPLTDFEQVLLGVIADEPRSGYGLKKMFSSSPASVYQPSPGALYPALRRLEERGLLQAEKQVSRGRRALRLYQVTEAGL